MSWRIRRANAGDGPVLRRCARAAFAGYVPRMDREPAPMYAELSEPIANGQVHVACHPDGSILGFVSCRAQGHDMLLETLAVWPEHADQGIGRSLVAYVKGLAHTEGAQAISLYTNAAMTESLLFYPALGYNRTVRRQHEGYDRVFFRKPLG